MERREARDMEEEGEAVGDVGCSRGTRGRMVSGGGIIWINRSIGQWWPKRARSRSDGELYPKAK